MRLTIGVMGSSGGNLSEEAGKKAYRLGEAIAGRDAVLITGGCPGLPYEAVRGAKAKGGLVVGISPGLSIDEHRGKYASPVEGFDLPLTDSHPISLLSRSAPATWRGTLRSGGALPTPGGRPPAEWSRGPDRRAAVRSSKGACCGRRAGRPR